MATNSNCQFQTSVGELWINPKDLEEYSERLVNLQSELKDLEKKHKEEVNILQLKIKFYKDNKLDAFDENTFKVYSTLNVLKTKKSDIEKASVIAKLINE